MFTSGFEKVSMYLTPAQRVAAVAAAAAGLGALSGHAGEVQKKLMNARVGKKYKAESYAEKHPIAAGALTLGYHPAVSMAFQQRKLDMANPKVRALMKEHQAILGSPE